MKVTTLIFFFSLFHLVQLRYQKCLDAHPQGFRQASTCEQSPGRGLSATLKSLVGTLTGRKAKGSES